MTTIIRDFTVCLTPDVIVPPHIDVSQYDKGEVWRFTVVDENGQTYSPSSASILGKKSDGTIITVAASVSGGKVLVTETEQMTAAAGNAVYELRVDNAHGTENFIVDVEENPTNGGTASASDIELIQQAVESAERIASYGSPLTATSSSQMTNHNSVYVYTGTTTSSLTNGHWYYWNGSAWADGGVYNAVAVNWIQSSEIAEVLTG